MFVSREVFHCKPGHAKDLVAVFKKLSPMMKEMGVSDMRIFTDISGQPYWTVVVEQEVKSLDEFAELSRTTMADPRVSGIFAGYHEHVIGGTREIYKRE
ncbi:MAG: hypothetical protein WB699_14650 [Bacteroidota bacterium]